MIIETKFKPGDQVWFMDGSRPEEWPVCNMDISVKNGKTNIIYHMNIGVLWISRNEKEVFPTKQKLLESL